MLFSLLSQSDGRDNLLAPYEGYWGGKWRTASVGVSIVVWNKITEELISGIVHGRFMRAKGFTDFDSAARFCSAFEEQRDCFRYRNRPKQTVPLCERRQLFRQRFGPLQLRLMAA